MLFLPFYSYMVNSIPFKSSLNGKEKCYERSRFISTQSFVDCEQGKNCKQVKAHKLRHRKVIFHLATVKPSRWWRVGREMLALCKNKTNWWENGTAEENVKKKTRFLCDVKNKDISRNRIKHTRRFPGLLHFLSKWHNIVTFFKTRAEQTTNLFENDKMIAKKYSPLTLTTYEVLTYKENGNKLKTFKKLCLLMRVWSSGIWWR